MKFPQLLEHLNRLARLDFLSSKEHSVAREVIHKLEASSSELGNFKIHPSQLFIIYKYVPIVEMKYVYSLKFHFYNENKAHAIELNLILLFIIPKYRIH